MTPTIPAAVGGSLQAIGSLDAGAVPPVLAVLAAALLSTKLPRRAGHALGALTTAAVAVWALTVPAGVYLRTEWLGFEVVLLYVDEFSRLMGLIFALIGTGAVVYSYASGADRTQIAFALSYVGTSLGAVFAGDWLTLVFFWELMAVTSTLLVWDYGGAAVRAGFRYALLHAVGGSLLMGAVLWYYGLQPAGSATFLFGSIPGVAVDPGLAGFGAIPAVMAAVGIGVNVGFVGLHAWLPDTYPRPHYAASVFLSVYTTKTGVYAMYRAFPDGAILIAYMGGAMALVGVGYALVQNDMRRLLSYHIQSQVGYMIAGVGLAGAVGVSSEAALLARAGAFAHVFNHILYKSLLFMTAGVVLFRTGEENLKKLGGLARQMPLTAVAFAVAALSIAGFPYFNGFVSKGLITAAAHEAHYDVLYYALLLGGVGTFMSFAKFGYYAFVRGEYDGDVADARPLQAAVMLVVAGLCVLFGLRPDLLFAVLPGPVAEAAHPYSLSHIAEGFVLAALGIGGFLLLKKPLSKIGRVPDVDVLYGPAALYGTRGIVVGITETYAAVDRVAVTVATTAKRVVTTPTILYEALPAFAGGPTGDEDRLDHPLRATIGASVLVLAFVVAVGVVALSL